MKFMIDLLSSQDAQFHSVGHDRDVAEQWLIQQHSPCFNVSHNVQPTAVPPTYFPPNAKFRRRRTLSQYIREAQRAVKAEDNQLW